MTNQAAQYGVTIQAAPETAAAWRAVSVRRLTPAQNGSSHNVFVKVLQPNGDRDRNPNLRIGWTWEGRRPNEDAPPVKLDKSDHNERGHGDVPISTMSQKIAVWIQGDGLNSDRVAGMHTNFPYDEGPGNTRGHYSYEVIFQRSQGVVIVPPVEPDKPTTPDTVTKAEFLIVANALQNQVDELKAILKRWDGD